MEFTAARSRAPSLESTLLRLPAVPCSIPIKCHPNHATLCSSSNAWALKLLRITDESQARKIISWKIPLSFCLAAPDLDAEIADYQTLLLCCNWTWIVAILDDVFDSEDVAKDLSKSRHWRSQIIDACTKNSTTTVSLPRIDHRHPAKESLLTEFGRLMRQLRSRMPSPRMFERFVESHQRWLDGCVEQARRRELGDLPTTFDDYARYRRYTILVEPFFVLLELCMGIDLRDEDLVHLAKSFEAAVDYAFLLNDLVSVRQDLDLAQVQHPLLCLGSHREEELQPLLDTLASMVLSKEADFTRVQSFLERQAMRNHRFMLLKYVRALSYVVSGCYYWHHVSGRYTTRENKDENGVSNKTRES